MELMEKIAGRWPVPGGSRGIPREGPGSFWEDRGDRHHCGVDIYALEGSSVVSVSPGRVASAGVFTSPEKVHYWNTTYYILIEAGGVDAGLSFNYAELGSIAVKPGDTVLPGQILGRVGSVLNPGEIGPGDPAYIQRLKDRGDNSMLHFEVYSSRWAFLLGNERYLGGNWFGLDRPAGLLDPGDLLAAVT